MNFVYLYISGSEWEDIIVLLSQKDAIQKSIENPANRVEIFRKTVSGYEPSYSHYKNGKINIDAQWFNELDAHSTDNA